MKLGTLTYKFARFTYYFNYGNSASFINAFDQSIKEYESDNFSNINNELLVINCWDKLINDEDN